MKERVLTDSANGLKLALVVQRPHNALRCVAKKSQAVNLAFFLGHKNDTRCGRAA